MMPLVSLRLITLAAVLTLLAGVATVLVWRRWGRWRLLTRPVGILLFQVLLLLTVGLIVNRAEKFYPSWEALSGDVHADEVVAPALPDGLLDAWLRQRARADGSAVTPWEPAQATSWKLAAAPVLTVPATYLSRASSTFPAVLALVPAGGSAATTAEAARGATATAGPAVVLSAPVGPKTRATDLATALTTELARDVRVSTHSWALVAPLAEARRAAEVVAAAPSRFATLVLVGSTAAASVPGDVTLPAAIAVAVTRPTAPASAQPSPGRKSSKPPVATPGAATARASAPLELPCAAGSEWGTAIGWAIGQTPVPLNPPVILPSLAPAPSAPPSPATPSGGPR